MDLRLDGRNVYKLIRSFVIGDVVWLMVIFLWPEGLVIKTTDSSAEDYYSILTFKWGEISSTNIKITVYFNNFEISTRNHIVLFDYRIIIWLPAKNIELIINHHTSTIWPRLSHISKKNGLFITYIK